MMNHSVTGWGQFKNPRYFGEYGRQRGWERDNTNLTTNKDLSDGFQKVNEQMRLPFDEM